MSVNMGSATAVRHYVFEDRGLTTRNGTGVTLISQLGLGDLRATLCAWRRAEVRLK